MVLVLMERIRSSIDKSWEMCDIIGKGATFRLIENLESVGGGR